jgi:hypothetical protein
MHMNADKDFGVLLRTVCVDLDDAVLDRLTEGIALKVR